METALPVHEERDLTLLNLVLLGPSRVVVLQRAVDRRQAIPRRRHRIDEPVPRRVLIVV